MKRNPERRAGERGSAFLLVMVLGLAILGIVGLALDGGSLYVTKQRAQAAADAAALAGVMDLYRGKDWTTASNSATAYGAANGFASSEVSPSPTCTIPCNGLGTIDSSDVIQVTVTKVVNTIFLRAVGVNSSTVRAVATAAVTVEPQPVPILVLHPTASGSFSINGSSGSTSTPISICGGPTRSIQVNSTSTTSTSSPPNAVVDLHLGGPSASPPNADGCSPGTGSDFANVSSQNPYLGTLNLGTRPGHYVPSASSIADPLLGVPAPTQPVNGPAQPGNAPTPLYVCGPPSTGAPQRCPIAAHGCPPGLANSDACALYSPGYYPNGINVSGSVFAQFRPGIYWINHGGFQLGQNGIARLAMLAADQSDPLTGTGWTNNILIYNSPSAPVDKNNDRFIIAANSGQLQSNATYPDAAQCGSDPVTGAASGGNCLQGSPTGSGSVYKGILFFQNRATATTLNHSFSGGGGLTLKGTIYLTHTAASIAADGKYQLLSLGGNSGPATRIKGEIIVDELSVSGTAGITMNLSSDATYSVRQVALVQ